jgi:hypothetical protein
VHINQETPLGGSSLGTLESGIDVVLVVAATQRLPFPRVDDLAITGRGVEVPEHTSVRCDPQLGLT